MASMLNKVVEVSSPGQFQFAVRFNDGAGGIHDCSEIVNRDGAMLTPLRNEAFFAKVHLEYGAPTWPNGYDMCPDWLRMEMEKSGELRRANAAE